MKVMLIDDDEQTLVILAQVLETVGFTVTAYSQPEIAVADFDHSYCLVLSDIKMPGLNGFEVLKAVRTINPQVKFIFITAFAGKADEALARSSGAEDVLFKPIDVYRLIEIIRRLSKT